VSLQGIYNCIFFFNQKHVRYNVGSLYRVVRKLRLLMISKLINFSPVIGARKAVIDRSRLTINVFITPPLGAFTSLDER
jgi:hypothetical protein